MAQPEIATLSALKTQGDSFVFEVALTADDGTTPVDGSGWTWKSTLKLDPATQADTAAGVVQALSTGASPGITFEAGGKVVVTFTPTQTANLVGKYRVDLRYKDGAVVDTVLKGEVTFEAAITQSMS